MRMKESFLKYTAQTYHITYRFEERTKKGRNKFANPDINIKAGSVFHGQLPDTLPFNCNKPHRICPPAFTDLFSSASDCQTVSNL